MKLSWCVSESFGLCALSCAHLPHLKPRKMLKIAHNIGSESQDATDATSQEVNLKEAICCTDVTEAHSSGPRLALSGELVRPKAWKPSLQSH